MLKTMKKIFVLFLIAAMALTSSCVNGEESKELLFEETKQIAVAQGTEFMEIFSIPGMTIALVDIDNNFTWLQGLGYADTASQVYVTEDTLFGIGSTAKVFTAVAIMQLVEAGILDLDEPIVTYLPEFSILSHPIYGGDYRNITTRMLLSHVSGMPGDSFAPGTNYTFGGHDRDAMNRLFSMLADMYMQDTELNRFAYANNGYVLLGILVATLSGYDNYFDGFVSYTQENIFTPADMVLSSFEVGDCQRAHLARPHYNTTSQGEFPYVSVTPTGGMVSNSRDMAQFMHIMLGGGALGDDDKSRILSQESVQQMIQIQDFDLGIILPPIQMGLGLMHRTQPDGSVSIGHGGGLPHYVTEMILDFDNGIGVFVSANSTSSAAAVSPLAHMIWQAAVQDKTGESLPLPSINMEGLEPISLPVETLHQLEGWYTMGGQVALGQDGILYITQFPGMPPEPLTLTPMANGSFDSALGRIWFEEVGGTMTIFHGDLKTSVLGERIEVSESDPNFSRWVGTYYSVGYNDMDFQILHHLRIGINESNFAYIELHIATTGQVISFLLDKVDDYMYFIAGTGIGHGIVVEFNMDDDTAGVMFSGGLFVKK